MRCVRFVRQGLPLHLAGAELNKVLKKVNIFQDTWGQHLYFVHLIKKKLCLGILKELLWGPSLEVLCSKPRSRCALHI